MTVKGSLTGNVGMKHQTIDEREYSFNVQQVYNLWDRAYQETVKEFGGKDFNELSAVEKARFEEKLGERFYDSVSQTYKDYVNWAKTQNVNNYGATAYGSRIAEKAGKFGEKAKEVWDEVKQPFTEEERTALITGKVREAGIVEPPNLPNIKPNVVSLPKKE